MKQQIPRLAQDEIGLTMRTHCMAQDHDLGLPMQACRLTQDAEVGLTMGARLRAAFLSSRRVFARVAGIVRLTLAEIFEEAAYARFLERHGMQSSRAAYAGYLRESEISRARKPRCC
jgi:hypothetical protein